MLESKTVTNGPTEVRPMCLPRYPAVAYLLLVRCYRAEPMAKRNISLNTHFRIEPCASCPIPGYLIVSPRVPVSSLTELASDAQAALGATLVAATRAIEAVV